MNLFINKIKSLLEHSPSKQTAPGIISQGNNCITNGSQFSGKNRIEDNCAIRNSSIGYATTIGRDCILSGPISMGNYCQLAPCVKMFASDHPFNTMSNFEGKVLFGGRRKSLRPKAKINIGHDVWIGTSVVILKGVNVGNGAVIAAGSIVTRDVEPFSIVGGNPAKKLKDRFPVSIVSELMELQWWNITTEQLAEYEQLFKLNLNDNVDDSLKQLRTFKESLEKMGKK